jgi:hypothetical protein
MPRLRSSSNRRRRAAPVSADQRVAVENIRNRVREGGNVAA